MIRPRKSKIRRKSIDITMVVTPNAPPSLWKLLATCTHTLLHRSNAAEQASSVLHIPVTLVQDICDLLPPVARIALSQTCQAFHNLFHGQCVAGMRNLSQQERLDVLVELANILPDHRICFDCQCLHLLDIKDIPKNPHPYSYYKSPGCPFKDPIWSRHRTGPFYGLAFRHVQLATKFDRHTGWHPKYASGLMKKCKASHPSYKKVKQSFTAEPKIVQGRFLLHVTWTVRILSGLATLDKLSRVFFCICPHLGLSPLPRGPNNGLETAIRAVLATDRSGGKHQERLHSCKSCPTNYLVTVENGDTEVVVRVWQNLGDGLCQQDPYWVSHIRSSTNNFLTGYDFPEDYGNIRETFENSLPRPKYR